MPGKRELRRRARLHRRIPRQELAKRRAGAWIAREYQKLQPEVIVELEAMFFALAAEMRQWPDTWEIDPHGDEDGNNPHVWFPYNAESVWHRARGDGSPIRFTHNLMDKRCTCGLLHSEWTGISTMTAYVKYLMQRNVQ